MPKTSPSSEPALILVPISLSLSLSTVAAPVPVLLPVPLVHPSSVLALTSCLFGQNSTKCMKKEGEGSFASMNSIRFSTPTTYRAPGELISGAEAIEIIEIEQVVCSFQFAPSFLPSFPILPQAYL